MTSPHSRRGARLCAAAVAAALLSPLLASPARAQDDDPYAPESRPDFSYPTQRDYSSVFGDDPVPKTPWPPVELGDGPFEMESWAARNVRAVVVASGFEAPRDIEALPDRKSVV